MPPVLDECIPNSSLPTGSTRGTFSFILKTFMEYLVGVRLEEQQGVRQAKSLAAWHLHSREYIMPVAGLRAETLEPPGFKYRL